MSFHVFYFFIYLLAILSILLSIFALLHNNWYTIGKKNHPVGLFGGCIEEENLNLTRLFNKSKTNMDAKIIIIKDIISSSKNKSWGSSMMIIFILSFAIKFFNLCIVKFGRKQIYTFYNYTEKSTCLDGCLENFDDGLPFFKFGNSYFIEILSTILLIFSYFLFLLYLYKSKTQSCKYIEPPKNTLLIENTSKELSNNELLISNDHEQSVQC
ncbi:Hypothetical protein SRAE_2000169400 [Strongyloides ratti]|uniref:Uncharacterized protein n=1 Tax=Strongyloides ratti TaxID=34506 RepID=A0A090MYE2_STRRB|nr:Hypothetical protein SRAE_2000169400 [Strongyloides ratti]CEF67029.1 Hypothetical protein SRAE_2000169400 [Strongyloides ratti]